MSKACRYPTSAGIPSGSKVGRAFARQVYQRERAPKRRSLERAHAFGHPAIGNVNSQPRSACSLSSSRRSILVASRRTLHVRHQKENYGDSDGDARLHAPIEGDGAPLDNSRSGAGAGSMAE